MLPESRCSECRESFPDHLTINGKTATVCPLCAWVQVCAAHGTPPAELLPRGEQAKALVEDAADLVTRRGRADSHPARELIQAVLKAAYEPVAAGVGGF